jgi:predicted MFS family arabinose efflux permease
VAAIQIPLGIALDRFGPKRVVPVALAIAATGCLVFAVAGSGVALGVGRALIGMGMGAVLMGAMKTLSLTFDSDRYATAFGLLVGIGTAGGLASAAPLQLLVAGVGWRSAFFIAAAAVALAAVLVWRFTPALEEHHTERSGLRATVLHIVKSPAFLRVAAFSVFMAGGLLSVRALWAGPYLGVVHGASDSVVGAALTAATIGMIIGYPVAGGASRRIGTGRVVFAAAVPFLLCFIALALLPFGTPVWILVVLYFLFGFTGAPEVHLLTQAKELFPPALTGRATTLVNVVAIGSSFLLQWLFGVVIDLVSLGAGGTVATGYRIAFGMIAALGAITMAIYLPVLRGGKSAAAARS